MVRIILDWVDKKSDAIDENTKHPLLKSFGLGAIEGGIDAAVIAYPFLIAGTIIAAHKLKKLRK